MRVVSRRSEMVVLEGVVSKAEERFLTSFEMME
jgi:hypothetical protein